MLDDQKKVDENSFNSDEVSLREVAIKLKFWVDYIKSKAKLIVLTTIFGSLVGLCIAFFEKPNYKAVLTFAMEDDKSAGGGLTGALGLASSFGIDLGGAGGGGAFAASNLAALMGSHLIIEKVLLNPCNINGEATTLAEYYIKINNLRDKWKKKGILKNVYFLPNSDRKYYSIQQDSLLKIFHKDLTNKDKLSITQKDKKITIINVEVNSSEEIFSKLFCEGIANEISDFYIQTKSKKARINTSVLQRQVDSVKNELNNNIAGVAKAADDVFNLNPTLNIKSAKSKKIQVNVTANTEVLKQLVVQLELSKITLRKETPLIQLIDKPSFPLEMEKFGKLKSIIVGGISAFFLSLIGLFILHIYSKLKEL